MKKKNILLGLVLGLGVMIAKPVVAQAASCASDYGYSYSGLESSYVQGSTTNISFTVTNVWAGRSYQLVLDPGMWGTKKDLGSPVSTAGTNISFSTTDSLAITDESGSIKEFFLEWEDGGDTKTCKLASYKIENGGTCTLVINQDKFSNISCIDKKSPVTFQVTNAMWGGEIYDGKVNISGRGFIPQIDLDKNGSGQAVTDGANLISDSWYFEVIRSDKSATSGKMCSSENILIQEECTDEQREAVVIDKPFDLCKQIPDATAQAKCTVCLGQQGIWTAIGCIDKSSTEGIVSKLMTVGMSIAGGIALLMILASAFMFATSEGEPKRTSEAKEILTSAIIGLIFIIFSVTVLQFIGVNILHIPGFGE